MSHRRRTLSAVLVILSFNTACSELGPEGPSPVAPTPQSQEARPARPSSDIPVTTYIQDLDGNGLPADTLSDGLGAYVHNVGGVKSILAANAFNGLTHGDWQFTVPATGRKFGIAFNLADAVQEGEPAYLVPATPPYWGTQSVPGTINIMCTKVNLSMKTMTEGSSFECPLGINFVFNGITYHRGLARSSNGFLETTDAQVVCNAVDADGCKDWYITPPIGQNSASRLNREDKRGVRTHIGTFYVRFRIHVTRP